MANQSSEVFFELLQAGVWENDVQLSQLNQIDFESVFQIADGQSVVGCVTAGLEHVVAAKIPQDVLLNFVGASLQLEQQNRAMNLFIKSLFEKMKEAGIYALLVKGQGIAQCYERPLWRACGDVDLLLDDDNYQKAREFLSTLAATVDEEDEPRKHLGMTIGSWTVELHGTLRGGWSKSVDKGINKVQEDTFKNKRVRIWNNDGVEIPLPSPDNDVIFVFTHILQHFFLEGVGLRQICDWCRLLWTYRFDINIELLEERLDSMRLMPKWQSFAALAVTYLGMPTEFMPFYSSKKRWHKNADVILSMVMDLGNFGHNRDLSYQKKYPFVISKAITFCMATRDNLKRFEMFPVDSIRVWRNMVCEGVKGVFKRHVYEF